MDFCACHGRQRGQSGDLGPVQVQVTSMEARPRFGRRIPPPYCGESRDDPPPQPRLNEPLSGPTIRTFKRNSQRAPSIMTATGVQCREMGVDEVVEEQDCFLRELVR